MHFSTNRQIIISLLIEKNIYYNVIMNDVLVLRSAIDLMDTGTQICWSNKHMLPPGYTWNEDGYVITAIPYPYVRACVGLRFSFLIGKLGMNEFVRQNLIVVRLLNGDVHKAIVTAVIWSAFKKSGFILDRIKFDKVATEVYALSTLPTLDQAFITWRRTWFSESCDYNTVSKVLRVENSSKIDADRDLMKVDEKYITEAVVEFTGFSRRRIDSYWSEKQWTKKLRTLFTIEEAIDELESKGILNPTREQIALTAGLSTRTVISSVKDMEVLLANNRVEALEENNVNKDNEL